MFKELKARLLMAAGDDKALGQLHAIAFIKKVKSDWEFFCGLTSSTRTVANVVKFLQRKYGITYNLGDTDIDENATFSREQMDRFLEGVAKQLLEANLVEFG